MKKLVITLILFFSVTTSAQASINICHTGENIDRIQMRSRLPGCEYVDIIDSDSTEYDRVKSLIESNPKRHLKWTTMLEERTQAEKDVADAAEAQAQEDAENAAIDDLRVEVKEVITALVQVYNSKVPVQYRMTKAEIIQQIKDNR